MVDRERIHRFFREMESGAVSGGSQNFQDFTPENVVQINSGYHYTNKQDANQTTPEDEQDS